MLKNYLKMAARRLRRELGLTFINTTGFAIGLTCCLLISLYVRHELSYDRYHEKADRIYRLTTIAGVSGSNTHFASAAPVMAAVLHAEFPEVEAAARVISGAEVVRVGDMRFREEHFYYADSTVFEVFSWNFIAGDPRTALDRPNDVVLTRTSARRYFGDANPVGRTLRARDTDYTVTAVIEDVPAPSHFRFDFLAALSSLSYSRSEDWLGNIDFKTYLVLAPGATPEALEAKLPGLIDRNVGGIIKRLGALFELELQPLTDIHLHSHLLNELEPNSNITYVYMFSAVAVIILLLACINFMNLSTARSVERAREVGMRKVLGAYRRELVIQFLAETLVLTLVASGLALGLVWLILPAFNGLVERDLSLGFAGNGTLLLTYLGVTLGIGVLAGSYPALFLSGFAPVRVLKGAFKTGLAGVWLRKGLVVFQFMVSATLIIGTFVVQRQLDYARSQELGFDKEQVIVLPLYQDSALMQRARSIKEEVLRQPGVRSATAANHYPGGPANDQVYFPEGKGLDESIHLWVYSVDADYLETLGMTLAEGRDFSDAFPGDSSALLVNQTALRQIGWDTAEGKRFYDFDGENFEEDRVAHPIIGVVEDFHLESFHEPIRPLVLRVDPGTPGQLLVRAESGHLPDVLSYLQRTWESTAINAPFTYSFLDQRFEQLYRTDERLGEIFGYFAGFAIFIACLGLFGLATFTAEQRIKEVGVRKVLGASVGSIVGLLSKDFLKLVGIAFAIAVPLAYFSMQRWLAGFAYHAEMGAGLFLITGALVVGIALATVSYHAVRAALADPVESLRCE
ncbi:MAG: ABC transporter permease [Rhodothermales bacterium]